LFQIIPNKYFNAQIYEWKKRNNFISKVKNMKYDLEERLSVFSKSLIKLLKLIEKTYINQNIISQLLKSWTSVGANYKEANWSMSPKDFKHKISICRKEAKETVYRLDLLELFVVDIDWYKKVAQEAKELLLIFNKISLSLKQKER
jgi:four helix bundle protein